MSASVSRRTSHVNILLTRPFFQCSGRAGEDGFVPPGGSEEAKERKGVRTGVLMSFGSNKGGQLGTGDIVNRLTPSVVTCSAWRRGAQVTEVSCGMHHTLAVAVVGNTFPVKRRVYAWGWGEHGRLGVGHEEMLLSPTEVALMSHRNVCEVRAGEQHSLALTESGDVYSWGSNRFGQVRRSESLTMLVLVVSASTQYFHGKTFAINSNHMNDTRHSTCFQCSSAFVWTATLYPAILFHRRSCLRAVSLVRPLIVVLDTAAS